MEGTDGTFVITVDEYISIGNAKAGGDGNGKFNCNSFQPPNVVSDRTTPAVLGNPCLPESIPT